LDYHDAGIFYDKFHPDVKMLKRMLKKKESDERIFRNTSESGGKPVSVRLGKFGPMAQIGDAETKKSLLDLRAEQNIYYFRRNVNLFLLLKV
jgi:DNA topoisomerase-1